MAATLAAISLPTPPPKQQGNIYYFNTCSKMFYSLLFGHYLHQSIGFGLKLYCKGPDIVI